MAGLPPPEEYLTGEGDVATEHVGVPLGAPTGDATEHTPAKDRATEQSSVQNQWSSWRAYTDAYEEATHVPQIVRIGRVVDRRACHMSLSLGHGSERECCQCRRSHTERVLVYPCAYGGHFTCLACMKKDDVGTECFVRCGCSVSYTHLTLPTKRIV